MATFKFGDADGLIVPVTTNNDTYIIGHGDGDVVNAFAVNHDVITLGDGNKPPSATATVTWCTAATITKSP